MITPFQIELRKRYLTEKFKCIKKYAYPDRQTAKNEMKRINMTKEYRNKLKTIYRCFDCNAWHLSSQDKQTSRNFRRRD